MKLDFAEPVRNAIQQRQFAFNRQPREHRATDEESADEICIGGPNGGPDGIVAHTFPGVCPLSFCRWLGHRFLFWPRGREGRRRISFVSSRLGQRLDLKSWWFTALRTASIGCDSQTDCLVTVAGTTASAAVVRASELFGIARINVIVDDAGDSVDEKSLAGWLNTAFTNFEQTERSPLETTVFLSPELRVGPDANQYESGVSGPLADRTLLIAAHRIHLLAASRRGNITPLVQHHLNDSARAGCAVVALSGNTETESTEPPVPSAIFDAGGVPWILTGPLSAVGDRRSMVAGDHSIDPSPPVEVSRLPDGPLEAPAEWLCHWTRAAHGPWPGEPQDDFLDALLLGCDTVDRSAFAALLHIIETGCLQTSQLSRDTVSFTQVPLAEFRDRRVYRKHRRKYDFEPWGIAVRRELLEKLGAQPVIYVDVTTTNLRSDSLFEQPLSDRRGRVSWKEEREWRLPCPLDLNDCDTADVVVFTNTDKEAACLRTTSPWTVVTVPGNPA